MKTVNNWFDIIQYSLLSTSCILCNKPGMQHIDLCAACYDALEKMEDQCYCCAKPFAVRSLTPRLCGQCQKNPPAFNKTYSPFIHQGAIRYLINQLKFNGAYKNSRLLGLLLADYLGKNAELPELIIPVPLHTNRYKQRGFNQTHEIAKTIAKELNLAIDISSCRRIKNTPHQISLTAKQRRKNIKNAFQITKLPKVNHIAILDDVMTTGATANELARLLKSAGINRVDVWLCARAKMDR
ncbi:MAG: ComF family protein [Methylococcaceae bacterium]|nr:ComF family protein [Methylococcaceae bacterium]